VKVHIVQPGLVNVDDAHTAIKQSQHELRILLSQQKTTRHVTELWNLPDFLETQAEVTTQDLADVIVIYSDVMLFDNRVPELSGTLKSLF